MTTATYTTDATDTIINVHLDTELARAMTIFEYAHPELKLQSYYINVNKSLETLQDDKPLSDIEMGAIFEVEFVNNDCPTLEILWTEHYVDFSKIEDYKFFGNISFALEKSREECQFVTVILLI